MRRLLLCFVFISLMASGCSSEETIYPDGYLFGQDAQIGFSLRECDDIIESEKGYYFFSGPNNCFLYFYDKAKKCATPLCNKPDCLHADEPDSYKLPQCNACLGISPKNLKYYMNEIYYVTDEFQGDNIRECMYKVSADGSKRQLIFQFPEYSTNIQIHRGYIYYSTGNLETVSGNDDSTTFKLCRYKLNSFGAKTEIIDEYCQTNGDIGDIVCYGNSIYYGVSYDENKGLVYYINRYDIRTKKVTRFLDEKSPQYTIFNDKFIHVIGDQGTYTCDLDGRNTQKISDLTGIYYCNDDYLFIDNIFDTIIEKAERKLTVIDSEWQTIKTIPLTGLKAFSLGCSNEYFFIPQEGKTNDVGNINTLACIPVDTVSGDTIVKAFFEFIPKVPFTGISKRE